MADDIPKCPRCPNGGNVQRISEATSERELAPKPGYTRTSEVSQCTCGWTLMRTKPPEKRGDEET